jgi:PAS domain S-box-containing protein
VNRRDLGLLFALLLAVLGYSFVSLYRSTRAQLEARFLQGQLEALRGQVAAPFERSLETALRNLEGLASQLELRAAVALGQPSSPRHDELLERLDALLADARFRQQSLESLTLHGASGELVASFFKNGEPPRSIDADFPTELRAPRTAAGQVTLVLSEGEPRLRVEASVEAIERELGSGCLSLEWSLHEPLAAFSQERSPVLGELALINDIGQSALPGAQSLSDLRLNLSAQELERIRSAVAPISLATSEALISVTVVSLPSQPPWRFIAATSRDSAAPLLGRELERTIALAAIALVLVLALGWIASRVQLREVASRERASWLQLSLEEKDRSERFLNSLFDAITDVIIVQDVDFNIIRSNRVAREVYGAEINGSKCYQVYRGKSVMNCKDCPVEATVAKGRPVNTEMVHPKTGAVWQINIFPLFDEKGQVQAVIEHARNITERRALEAKLVQSEKLSTLGEMAAGIAHEINNPVGVVSMFAQLAAEDLQGKPELSELAEKIQVIDEHSQQIGKIVKDLLQFARKSEGRRALVEVEKILDRAMTIVELKKMIAKVQISRSLEPGLQVYVDEGQISQVVLNLIVNALHAMEGEGTLLISAEAIPNGAPLPAGVPAADPGSELAGRRRVRISVKDSGPGIAPADLRKVFDPFFTTKEQGHGTGLGLSVSFGIIRDHGGMIFVDSKPGQGANFLIELPSGQERATQNSQRMRVINV